MGSQEGKERKGRRDGEWGGEKGGGGGEVEGAM